MQGLCPGGWTTRVCLRMNLVQVGKSWPGWHLKPVWGLLGDGLVGRASLDAGGHAGILDLEAELRADSESAEAKRSGGGQF